MVVARDYFDIENQGKAWNCLRSKCKYVVTQRKIESVEYWISKSLGFSVKVNNSKNILTYHYGRDKNASGCGCYFNL